MSTVSIQAPITRPARMTVQAAAASPLSAPSTRLRLTVRGRRVLATLAALPLAVGIAASALAGGAALASGDQAAAAAFDSVTVLPGDTLWSIAAEAAPGTDPRVVIEDIKRLNNLTSGAIQVGAAISIPTEYSR
ncbi:LysM peptidoglycan-binding domain-containing protein [Microbacterium alcoholitolerans]|uniref:LysM peptidoglycan-binding domain-containing protein n=1 Tax=unclassified Microbacterium TaxID=2609290 RepID=UPI003D174131